MFSASRRNSSREESFTIATLHVVYRSNWLERTSKIKDLLSEIDWYYQERVEGFSHVCKKLVGVEYGKVSVNSRMFPVELREIQAYFHLFMRDLPHPFELTKKQNKFNNPKKPFEYTGDPNWELEEPLRQDVQPVEKAVLACLFLDRDAIPARFRYIHDLMHRTPIERFNRSYTLPDHWEIPLPDQTREVSSLGLEEGTVTVEDLRTLRTRSYYHIQKDELMERVRYLLCRGLRDEMVPQTYEDIEEMYERLLDVRGAIMWQTASDQFPEDEVIFLWNRSMTSQSLERAWHLPVTSERVNDSIPNFKVTHHGIIKDEDKFIPTMDTATWTNIQLRDALGYDWMFDQGLTLENNWMDAGREIDHHVIGRIATFADRVATILPVDDNYQGGFLIETDSDHVFLEPRKNLVVCMSNPNYVDSTQSLRENSDLQPINPSQETEHCLYNGSTLRDFNLVKGNLFKSLNMKDFSGWGYKPKRNSFHNTSGLQGAYMLNLFFDQNRLDGLYSWYQDIYLANVRYLREYLRSVDLNEDYQLPENDGLTLSDKWQIYLRNSNIFVDAYVRNFGRLPYPFVELYDPNATSNELNNLKLMRLSFMSDMNYLCFLTQSHFLRSMVDAEFESEPNLLSCMSERSMLLNNTSSSIVTGIQVNNMTFNGLNALNLHSKFLEVMQRYNSLPSLKIKEFLDEYFLLEEGTFLKEEKKLKSKIILPKLYQLIWEQERSQAFRFSLNYCSIFNNPIPRLEEEITSVVNSRLSSSKNFWLDYLTLTRFLQDDPSYEDELSWTGWIDRHFNQHMTSVQEQLNKLMFSDVDCQVHNQAEHDRILEGDKQDLLDQWYLSSENRKVSPNLHNRELRSLLPVFLMSQVLESNQFNLDFLPTDKQLNDPVRFVSSLELANSFFDDYHSRKTWNDDDVIMLARVLYEYNLENGLSEELNEEFFNHVKQGNCDGIVDLLLLLDLTVKTWQEDKGRDNIYLKLNDYGVSTLDLRRRIRDYLYKGTRYNDENVSFSILSEYLFEDILRYRTWSKSIVDNCLRTLNNLRLVEQGINQRLIQVRQLVQVKAPFLRTSLRESREVNNVVDLKLLYLDDSVIRNIFVRNNVLNRLVRLRPKDGVSLTLSSLNVDRDREVIDRTIDAFVLGQRELESWELALEVNYWLTNNKHFLRLSYLGWLLKGGVNLKVTEDPANFSRKLRMFSRLLSSGSKLERLPGVIGNEFIELMEGKHATLMNDEYVDPVVKVRVWDARVEDWVNPQVNSKKAGVLLSKREYLKLLIGKNLYGMELPVGVLNHLSEENHDRSEDQQENKYDEDELALPRQLDDSFLTLVTFLDESDHSTEDVTLNLSLTL